MEISTPQFGLPGAPQPSRQFVIALGLLSEAIATTNASIAAERRRSRRDPHMLDRLRTERSAAIRDLTRLHNDDPDHLAEVISEYRTVRSPILVGRPDPPDVGRR